MAEKNVTALDTLYFVNDAERTVTLEVITGGVDQTSTINIEIDDHVVAKGIHGHLPQKEIGTNRSLQGKILSITCTIADTSKDTNFTELRIRLNGGIMFIEYPLFATVEKDGDSVNYICIIRFFEP